MNHRVRELRESLRLSRAAFGERIGVSGDVVNNIERGRAEIKDYFVKLIAAKFGVSERWLLTGEGEMLDPYAPDPLEGLMYKYRLSSDATAVVRQFAELPAERQEVILDYIRGIASEIMNESDDSDDLDDEDTPTPADLHAELDRQLKEEERRRDTSAASSESA